MIVLLVGFIIQLGFSLCIVLIDSEIHFVWMFLT